MAAVDDIETDVTSSVLPVLLDLKDRAQNLLSELESFREHIRSVRQEGQIEIAHFRSTAQSELSMLDKLSKKPETESTLHIARSSNLPFLETIWNTAKKSSHLVSLHKRVYYESPLKSLAQNLHHVSLGSDKENGTGKKNAAVIVDTITDRGLLWTKISLVTNTRLLFDLAKQGWISEGSDDEDTEGVFPDTDDESDVPLVRNTRELCFASKSFRTRTKMPIVHLVLPRVQPGLNEEVDEILEQCRAVGAVVFCGEDLQPVPPLPEAMHKMVPDPLSEFSSTLNIDCTILLALVSEFSHAKVSKEAWFHKQLQRQVEIEGNQNLLPSLLYPAICNHGLVCTTEAANRMREIVDTIGTPSEKARTLILFDTTRDQRKLVQDMQQWSTYEVPRTWQLPVQVVDQNQDDCQAKLPPQAATVGANLTSINHSVFLYGWAKGITTITSNRSVAKQIEGGLESFENLDESIWPSIWLCPTARSLVGKEKRGAKKEDRKETGAWPLPDPLRREHQRRNGLDVLTDRAGHEVEDRRPNGYPCDEVLAAKNAARHEAESGIPAVSVTREPSHQPLKAITTADISTIGNSTR